jgi:hypothetical protein
MCDEDSVIQVLVYIALFYTGGGGGGEGGAACFPWRANVWETGRRWSSSRLIPCPLPALHTQYTLTVGLTRERFGILYIRAVKNTVAVLVLVMF